MVATASGSIGTDDGRQRRTGCSISHQDSAATSSVAAHLAANNGQPDHPVRSPLSTRNTGQCQR
jgi:hypothetical protein